MNKELKGWKKKFYEKFPELFYFDGGHRDANQDSYTTCEEDVKFFISSLLKTQKAEILEKVNEIKKRFRCAACEGSKCQHTLGCQALDDVRKEIGDKIVWE